MAYNLVNLCIYIIICLFHSSAYIHAEGNNVKNTIHPVIVEPNVHHDSRFEENVLVLTSGLKTTTKILYVIFERSVCQFNERFDAVSEQCICSDGFIGEDCVNPEASCSRAIPVCANGGICSEPEGVCLCNKENWDGADCARPADCSKTPCPYQGYQRCFDAGGSERCEESLPIRIQFLVGPNCTKDEDCGLNEQCRDSLCSCREGTVKKEGYCEIGLITCFSQQDCSVLHWNLVCRDVVYMLSNKFHYTGRGPYCLCYDDSKIDQDTGLCTSETFVFSEQKASYFKEVGFGETYWPLFFGVGVLGMLCLVAFYKVNKGSQHSSNPNIIVTQSATPINPVKRRFRSSFDTIEEKPENSRNENAHEQKRSSHANEEATIVKQTKPNIDEKEKTIRNEVENVKSVHSKQEAPADTVVVVDETKANENVKEKIPQSEAKKVKSIHSKQDVKTSGHVVIKSGANEQKGNGGSSLYSVGSREGLMTPSTSHKEM